MYDLAIEKKNDSSDSLIFYKWRGIHCVRTKGNTGRQAPVAREQASILGRASALSARLRKSFKPMLPGPTNRPLMYRLNNTLQSWLRSGQPQTTEMINSVSHLNRFSFSTGNAEDNHFYIALPVSRTFNGNLVLHIPALDSPNPISPLPFNGQINLHIIAVSCSLHDKNDSKTYETEVDIHYDGTPIPARDLLLPVQTMPGRLTVVALSVNKLSAGIIEAMYN